MAQTHGSQASDYETELELSTGRTLRIRETFEQLGSAFGGPPIKQLAGVNVVHVTLNDGRDVAIMAPHIISITSRRE